MTSSLERLARLLKTIIVGIAVLLVLFLITTAPPSTPNVFASPMSTPGPLRGIHLGNHVHGEDWITEELHLIDPSLGGTWPNLIVLVSSNIYDRPRAAFSDCQFQGVEIPGSLATSQLVANRVLAFE